MDPSRPPHAHALAGEHPPSPPRARAPRGALSRERVLEAALRLLEREGEGALSMRRVAAELGSAPMSLYRHVRNKEDLVDGVIALALEDLTTKPLEGDDWTARTLAWMLALREEMLEHPSIIPLLRSSHMVLPAVLAPVELVLEELLRAGFSRPRAARSAWELLWITLSFVAIEQRSAREPETLATRTFSMAKLHADDLPHLAEALPDLLVLDAEDIFQSVARHLVAGLRVELDAVRAGAARGGQA
ncbi:MAG: TetR/AcrR family transcriptional regulator C-terminal domain-containing protein [Myxococcales bacterium]|nr:TetR/AcrR family transcriptional regulator C-terminal domain-containing protein [Myxococcales bacterium]